MAVAKVVFFFSLIIRVTSTIVKAKAPAKGTETRTFAGYDRACFSDNKMSEKEEELFSLVFIVMLLVY